MIDEEVTEELTEDEILEIPMEQMIGMAAEFLIRELGFYQAVVRLVIVQDELSGHVDGAADDAVQVAGADGAGDADDGAGPGGHDGSAEDGDVD